MALIAGVDSSTQSTKVEIRDQTSGEVVASGSAPHPEVSAPTCEQDPQSWWSAFEIAWEQAGAPKVASISVGGQQHGMVAVDSAGAAVHPAKLWNDTESAPDVQSLLGKMSPAAWAGAVGSVPVAAFTVSKLAWLRRTKPDAWAQIARIMLPHDYMTHRLTGEFTTDRGDASGTGYWSPARGEYCPEVLALIDDHRDWASMLPEVLGPMSAAGGWTNGGHTAVVAPGTGDNMAGALGVGLQSGEAVISLGTSGTVYAISETPTADPTGEVAGFADATGRFLPLVCTSNAAKVLDAVARLLGVDHEEFDRLALAAGPGGPTMLPYFDGERTPYRPDAAGMLDGLRSDISREQFARSAVDGVVCGLLDGFDALARHADITGRVLLTGGASRSRAVQAVLAGLLGRPLFVSGVEQAVATGAAIQAAAVLEQVDTSTISARWGIGGGASVEHAMNSGDLRARYAELRDR